jgi:hypothetical protein
MQEVRAFATLLADVWVEAEGARIRDSNCWIWRLKLRLRRCAGDFDGGAALGLSAK